MLTLLYGSDAFGRQAVLSRLLADGGDEGVQGATRLDGSAISWIALREVCGARSLFAARQLLVVKDLLTAWSARAEGTSVKGASKPSPAEFVEFATHLPETTDLILVEGDISGSNRYLKALSALDAKVVTVREFSIPKDGERRDTWTADWVRGIVETRKGSIDGRAVRLLVQRCGTDLHRASNEIDKLLAFTAPLYSIGVADIELLVTDATETKGFELADAVCAKNPARAVDLAERLLEDGQAPEQLLALMSSRIRDLCLLANAKVERVPKESVSAANGWQPWRLGNLERSLARFTLADLTAAQAMLVSADHALKSRPSHERALVLLLTLFAIARRSDAGDLAMALAY